MAVIGLDVGTTGCKAVVYNQEGKILTSSYLEYDIIAINGNYEINPNIVWEKVSEVLLSVTKKCAEAIEAIGISTFGESAVLIDKEGNVLCNAMLYTDPRGIEECKKLVEYENITKVAAHPMYTISKILWMKENREEIKKRVYKYLLFEDFIIYKLTGEFCISFSQAARTGAFDVRQSTFCEDILKLADCNKEQFSIPSPSGTIAGVVKTLEYLYGVPVVTGGQDQVCAALGAGIHDDGEAVLGMGTVECITPIYSDPDKITHDKIIQGYCCVPYVVYGKYVTYAYSYTGGALLKWFRDKIAIELSNQVDNLYEHFNYSVQDLETELLLIPHFAGAATPYMDTNAVGAIVGLSVATTREEIYRAILEGCCFEMAINMEQLNEAGIKIDRLIATGGGAQSKVWLQMTADVLQIPVGVMKNTEAGTAGAAMLAGTAVGIFSTLKQAVERFCIPGDTYVPDLSRQKYYQNKYRKYKKMYTSIKEIMEG